MRDHNKAFCRLVAETFDCPGPVFEFGSYQVDGQEGYANLRELFPGKDYVGCDMRPGPGVDRVEDVTAISLPDGSAGTVLCIETFEHVFEVRKAFDEVFRVPQARGHFRHHVAAEFPDSWLSRRLLADDPNCLRRMLAPYAARVTGYQGYQAFPHTVMGVGLKAPVPGRLLRKAGALVAAYHDGWRGAEAELPSVRSFGGGRRCSIAPRASGARSPGTTRRTLRSTLSAEAVATGPRARIRDARRGGPKLGSQQAQRRVRGRLGTIPCQRPSIECLSWGWTVRPGPCWTRCAQRGLMPNLDAYLARAGLGNAPFDRSRRLRRRPGRP